MSHPTTRAQLHGPVIVLLDARGGVCARTATRWERFAASLHAHRLDEELAHGTPPENSPELAVRAAKLARPRTRRMLAESLRRLRRRAEEAASRAASPRVLEVPLDHLRPLHDEIEGLVRRLDAPVPVPARGVALVQLLLSDGAGPVHHVGDPERLRAALIDASGALDPSTDWPT
jgi:hypothetical protein